MSEAIWIELIKVLPAFLWVGFGFIALAIAKRIFTAQAPRMTRVETPWVTVELAQQAIEQASVRGTAVPVPLPEPDWSQLYPPLPSQQVGAGYGQPPGNGSGPPPRLFGEPAPFGGAPGGGPSDGDASPPDQRETGQIWGYIKRNEDPYDTDPKASPPKQPDTPPADEDADGTPGKGAEQPDDVPPSPVTEPNRQVPNVPPTYPIIAAPPGGPGGYYAPPIAARPTTYAASAPLPPYQAAPPYQPADSQRGLRAATKLALSADRLQGGAILWVDDHQEWNEPLIRLFRTAGITVDAVASTDEAMRALKHHAYDLIITNMGREAEPDGDQAGVRLLDQMIAMGVPTPAAFFTDPQNARASIHPRAVISTSSPEKLVDTVVDIVSTRRPQSQGSSWLDRLRS